jgi:hypothetical protein
MSPNERDLKYSTKRNGCRKTYVKTAKNHLGSFPGFPPPMLQVCGKSSILRIDRLKDLSFGYNLIV